jgi:hypothetical protein
MLVRLKINSSSVNPQEWWIVFVATSWIGNWIFVMINDQDLQTLISLMIGSIRVHLIQCYYCDNDYIFLLLVFQF